MSPKPTAQRRRDRRALLDNLLGRMLRGRLTTAEAALLAEQVREEQRAYDQTRRSLGETTAALTHHREAADATIRETEQRAEAAERMVGILDAVDQGRAHGAQRIMGERDQAQQDAEQAKAELKVLGRAAVEYQQRAWDAEAAVRELTQRAENFEGRAKAMEQRAEQAERSAKAWEDTARTYATDMDDARARVDGIRRYIDAAHEGDVCEGVRRDVRRLCAGEQPTYGPPGAPEVITDRATIRDTLAEPEPAECPHCPDGHTPADCGSQPWATWVGPERDSDGQPMTIHVARSAGAHVAESDAQWIRDRLNRP